MQELIKVWRQSRALIDTYFEGYTVTQLNDIPVGFRNNLIWNIGHVIAVQQSLVYRLSGLPMHLSDGFFERYKNGTIPDQFVTAEEVTEMRNMLHQLFQQTLDDWEAGAFKTYTAYTTRSGFSLASAVDALIFNAYHEALHVGAMMQIRKFIP